MPNLTVQTTKVGNTITASGTADAQVTCKLLVSGTVRETKQTVPTPAPPAAGSWSVTFNVTGSGPFQVNVTTADSKGATVGVPGSLNA
jgi:hypothetical protein